MVLHSVNVLLVLLLLFVLVVGVALVPSGMLCLHFKVFFYYFFLLCFCFFIFHNHITADTFLVAFHELSNEQSLD